MALICIVCPPNEVIFDTIDALEAHIASIHVRHFSHQCPQCPFERFCTESILHDHCIAAHQFDDYEATYQVNRQMLEQRARVRTLLFESLKFSWTSDMIDSSVPDDETNLIDDDEQHESDDDQVMVTSDMQMFSKKDDEQLEANDVERKPTRIDHSQLTATSTMSTDRVVTKKSTGLKLLSFSDTFIHLGRIRVQIDRCNSKSDKKRKCARPMAKSVMNMRCAECDELVNGRLVRRHAAGHLDRVMYECNICGHKIRTLREDSMKKHVARAHRNCNTTTVISSYVHMYDKELAAMCRKCFGYEYKMRKVVLNDDKASIEA